MHSMLFNVERDGHTIYIFGGGPQPPPLPFDPAPLLPLLEQCDEFWNEVPELGDNLQALALKHGLDPSAPLASWLPEQVLARVDAAAAALDINRDLLAPLRPWLVAQIFKNTIESRAGLQGAHTAEHVLAREAERLGIRVESEFATAEGAVRAFAGMPRDAEVQYLEWTLDSVEGGTDGVIKLAEAVAKGDLRAIEDDAAAMRMYPAFHRVLIVDRNVAWMPRINRMFDERSRAFIVMGGGHLVGDDGVVSLLKGAGYAVNARAP